MCAWGLKECKNRERLEKTKVGCFEEKESWGGGKREEREVRGVQVSLHRVGPTLILIPV